jgi:hypothetical protein
MNRDGWLLDVGSLHFDIRYSLFDILRFDLVNLWPFEHQPYLERPSDTIGVSGSFPHSAQEPS